MNNHVIKLDKRQRRELFLFFTTITFAIFVFSLLCVSVLAYFVVRTGALNIVEKNLPGGGRLIIFIAITSALIGLLIVAVTAKSLLKHIDGLINKMNSLASGDYTTRIDLEKPFRDFTVINSISDSFNTMAEELQNTEALRSDFVNNFSHEFKTPIVSIAGFAKLLKRGKPTEQQKKEYIDIIEEESLRLSYMATNVLNLTRVENQTILTDISTYNLSEQLRSCILLLENKWTRKNLDICIDFSEYNKSANEELLKHVWINLLDNAIKFSPEYGIIEVRADQDKDFITVTISNNGEPIPQEVQKKIFNKFYQTDESHSSEGNGIGLAIVKRVIELHNGTVSIESKDNLTSFIVKLPKAH